MSNSNSSSEETPVCELSIQGLGHVPSFKNTKRIAKIKRRGKEPLTLLITDPVKRKWMDRAIDALESQLMSLFPTPGPEISTAASARSAMSLLPADDAWQFVPELRVSVRKVEKGKEGAVIRIYRFSEEAAK